jgi:hypothetical protein
MTWTLSNTLVIAGIIASPIVAAAVTSIVNWQRMRIEGARWQAELEQKMLAYKQQHDIEIANLHKEIAEIKRDSDQQEMLLRKIDSNIGDMRATDLAQIRERLARVEESSKIPRRRAADR